MGALGEGLRSLAGDALSLQPEAFRYGPMPCLTHTPTAAPISPAGLKPEPSFGRQPLHVFADSIPSLSHVEKTASGH